MDESALRTEAEEASDLLTVSEVAQRLRVDQTTVRRWIAHHVLAAVELPHKGKRRQYRIKGTVLTSLLNGPI